MDQIIALISQPLISSALTFLGGLVALRIKAHFEIRQKKLELEALRLTTQIQIESESKARLTGTATPTGMRHQLVKAEIKKVCPEASGTKIDEAIRAAVPTAKRIAGEVARSTRPLGPGESGEHRVEIPQLYIPKDLT